MRLTIAICTWNRADSLRRTLASLSRVALPSMDVSLVVIDNNCTDHTAQVVSEAVLPMPVTRVAEGRSGLSNARNAAVEFARVQQSDMILFTDDDIEVEPQWLVAYEQALLAHPDAILLGGPITPVFSREPAGWMRRNMSALRGPFGLVDHGAGDRLMDADHDMPFGANMMYRVAVLGPAPFDPQLGVAPGRRMGGEESDLSRRLLREHGQSWVYVAGARVLHHLPPQAVTPQYLFMNLRSTGHLHARDVPAQPGTRPPRWLLRQYATVWLLRRCWWLTRNVAGPYATLFSHEALLRGQIDMYTTARMQREQYAR